MKLIDLYLSAQRHRNGMITSRQALRRGLVSSWDLPDSNDDDRYYTIRDDWSDYDPGQRRSRPAPRRNKSGVLVTSCRPGGRMDTRDAAVTNTIGKLIPGFKRVKPRTIIRKRAASQGSDDTYRHRVRLNKRIDPSNDRPVRYAHRVVRRPSYNDYDWHVAGGSGAYRASRLTAVICEHSYDCQGLMRLTLRVRPQSYAEQRRARRDSEPSYTATSDEESFDEHGLVAGASEDDDSDMSVREPPRNRVYGTVHRYSTRQRQKTVQRPSASRSTTTRKEHWKPPSLRDSDLNGR